MEILVTGGSGQVGKELQQILPLADYISSKDLNLLDEQEVKTVMLTKQYDVVIHLAAKVGGILENISKPSEYLEDNLTMNTNILKWSRLTNISRFIGVLSTCIYPDSVEEYPMTEDMLHLGPPTPTNFSYAYAKRCLAVQIDSMNKQYGTKYCYVTPCNLYGDYDKYDHRAHFVADLLRKIHELKQSGSSELVLYGTGKPLRQFMNASDLAKVLKDMIIYNITESFNVATPEVLSIHDVARIALNSLDCQNVAITYDSTKPDGQYRKDVSINKFRSIFPDFKFTKLEDGVRRAYEKNFVNNTKTT